MKNTTKSTTTWTRITKGIYKAANKYVVRKTVNGTRLYESFTNKAKAISYYKSLTK